MSPEASEPLVGLSCPAGQFLTGDGVCSGPVNPPTAAQSVSIQQPTSCDRIVAPVFILGGLCFVLMAACVIFAQRYNNARQAFNHARKQYDKARAWYEEHSPGAV